MALATAGISHAKLFTAAVFVTASFLGEKLSIALAFEATNLSEEKLFTALAFATVSFWGEAV